MYTKLTNLLCKSEIHSVEHKTLTHTEQYYGYRNHSSAKRNGNNLQLGIYSTFVHSLVESSSLIHREPCGMVGILQLFYITRNDRKLRYLPFLHTHLFDLEKCNLSLICRRPRIYTQFESINTAANKKSTLFWPRALHQLTSDQTLWRRAEVRKRKRKRKRERERERNELNFSLRKTYINF